MTELVAPPCAGRIPGAVMEVMEVMQVMEVMEVMEVDGGGWR